MKEHNTSHDHSGHSHTNGHHHADKKIDIVEDFKEEGPITLETLNIATHEATSRDHRGHARGGFKLTTPVAVIIGAIIIAFGIMGYGLIIRGGSQPSAPTTAFKGRTIDATDYIDGNAKSKVYVVEYSDPECPFCVQLHPTIKQVRNEYGSKVAFVYRYFPLTQIHPHAFDESKAILCAGKVGGTEKFYEYVDSLFGYKITNKTTQLTATGKEDIARNIGLDKASFTACMNNNNTTEQINASLTDGQAAGVQGTPSTFILVKTRKGYEVASMVDGARPYEYVKAAIDQALSK